MTAGAAARRAGNLAPRCNVHEGTLKLKKLTLQRRAA